MRRGERIRLTPTQRRLLAVVRSFGRPATEKEIQMRSDRLKGRLERGRR